MTKPSFPFPSTVLVGGHKLKIVWKDDSGGEDLFGTYSTDKKVITLFKSNNPNEEVAWSTLYHEMLHASLEIGGLTYLMTDGLEEAVVRNFDSLMLPALKILFEQ
tara:strand:- start:1751 stop:2065 length:315 start_codon:yes stop_codon:yes gene_type:complete